MKKKVTKMETERESRKKIYEKLIAKEKDKHENKR